MILLKNVLYTEMRNLSILNISSPAIPIFLILQIVTLISICLTDIVIFNIILFIEFLGNKHITECSSNSKAFSA
jgi:hypothetical protein